MVEMAIAVMLEIDCGLEQCMMCALPEEVAVMVTEATTFALLARRCNQLSWWVTWRSLSY